MFLQETTAGQTPLLVQERAAPRAAQTQSSETQTQQVTAVKMTGNSHQGRARRSAWSFFQVAAVLMAVLGLAFTTAVEGLEEDSRLLSGRKKIDGIGLSGTAFMIPYNLGVAKTFLDYGMFKKYPAAGASGGALSASLGCSGMPFNKFKTSIFAAVAYCANATDMCAGSLGSKLVEALQLSLPTGSAYKGCNGRLFVQVTIGTVPQPKPDTPTAPCLCTETATNRGKHVSFFNSRSDFVSTLRTTTFLSRLADPACTRAFRKFPETCDGGYSDNLPCPPAALGEGKFCLKASVYPSFMWSTKTNTTGPADIYPGVRGESTLPFQDRALWATVTHNPRTVERYKTQIYQAGRLDAEYWLTQNGFKKGGK